MDPDAWTPARGWMIALSKAAYRILIGAAIVGGLVYLIWGIDRACPSHPAIFALLFMVCAAIGYPFGHAVGRKLDEDSGLAGRTIGGPILVMLIAAQIAAFLVAGAFRDEPGLCILVIVAGIAAWSAVALIKNLLID